MLSSVTNVQIATYRAPQSQKERPVEHGRDSFVPSNANEPRADLQFKQAFAAQQVRQSQQVQEENISTFPGREGYDVNFLGKTLALPKIDPSQQSKVATLIDNPNESELKYTNFSIVMNGERRQPFYTAVNIDGAQVVDVPRDGEWTIDGRIRRDHQLGNEAYRSNPIDKGHQVRRRDAAWGPNPHQASNDTFAYTNASLQHSALNQKEWLQLENHILDQLKSKGMKATVLTGPVMKDSDPQWDNKGRMERPTQMPQEFWKVVVWNDSKEGLKASAFVLSQADYVPNGIYQSDFESDRFGVYQVPVDQLEQMTRLDFGEVADSLGSAHQITTPSDAKVLR